MDLKEIVFENVEEFIWLGMRSSGEMLRTRNTFFEALLKQIDVNPLKPSGHYIYHQL
jgi:hypothetical protein